MKPCNVALSFMAACALAISSAHAQQKRAMTFDDLISMERVSEPAISPDGRWVAYTLATPILAENRTTRNIWVAATAAGTPPRQLTSSGADSRPQWAPDGTRLAFLSSRGGSTQIYVLSFAGGEPLALTHLSGDADNEQWSPDGRTIAFTSPVYPDCRDEACNRSRDDQNDKNKVKARVYDGLLFRHWTHWSSGKRSHLFVIAAPNDSVGPSEDASRNAAANEGPRDLTAGADYDVPPDERGDAGDIAFSPDSKELCFTAVTDRPEATSTNGDLFTVAVPDLAPGVTNPGGANSANTATPGAPRRITTNPGFDGHPVYSPDGRFIAYHAQLTPGYESDRWRLMLYERATQKITNLTENFDFSIQGIVWAADSRNLYFVAEDRAEQPIFEMAATQGSTPRQIAAATYNSDVTVSANGNTLAFTRTSLVMPAEVFVAGADGGNARQITHHNDAHVALLEMNPPEPFWFEGAGGTRVEGLLVRPPHFDAAKKYPLLFLVHGGPQGAWTDAWGYRWNEELFAAPGYVAVMVNPRGSTGYGQKFTDDIRNDWGGKVYEDLMKGADYAAAHYAFVDGQRMAAAGGSYGGYMMDWFATHTGRFKALISHAGPYDNQSMYGETEELWFVEHDLAGTPWSNPESFRQWSPSTYAAALGKFKTPTLVIGGEMDYRVPFTQDLQFFTALQRQGVPSKLVIFPDEGHWILKPQNSQLWYQTLFDWLSKYLK